MNRPVDSSAFALTRRQLVAIHFHMLWLDGVYEDTTERPQRKPRLHRTRAPHRRN